MANVAKFKTVRESQQIARQAGELARVKVIDGPDFGTTFVLMGRMATLGRGDENDIVLNDLKASRMHASISFENNQWILKDMGSANGLLHNGRPVRTTPLVPNDTLVIGETTLEFLTADSGTLLLVSPPRSLEQVKTDQSAMRAQRQRIVGLTAGEGGSPNESSLRMVLLLVVGGLGLWMLMDESSPTGSKKTKSPSEPNTADVRDLASYLPQADTNVNRTAEIFFRAGFRDYREKNFLRAKNSFETVLQISPEHRLAKLYLQNSEKAIEDEVSSQLKLGKKMLESGRLRQAKGNFESVMRLLYRDQSNPAYVEAKEQLEKVKDDLKRAL